jgi:hypothetical protein
MADDDGIRNGRLAALSRAGVPWDRYADWPRGKARLLLVALLAILIVAALVPISAGKSTVKTAGFVEAVAGGGKIKDRPRDDDLKLYDIASARIRKGENYYDFIAEEHRKANYPVRPGLAVRLPTLAYINAAIGDIGQIVAAIVLMLSVLVAWWFRLGREPGGEPMRLRAMAFLFVGASLGVNRYFFALHELWAGMLLALSFGLHQPAQDGKPGRYGAALAVAALAVAIREHALPFILLMAATAFWRRDWKESAAWTALTAAFLAVLAVHLHIVAQHTLPSDRMSPSWLEFRGLAGWLSNIVLSSNLRFLPDWIAAPAVLLMIFGWSGWKTWAGAFATFLYLGYGLLFMIAGRGDNFYWGVAVAPAMFIGLAFLPMAATSLWRASFAK